MNLALNYWAATEREPGGIAVHISGLAEALTRREHVVAIAPRLPVEAPSCSVLTLAKWLPRRAWIQIALPIGLRRTRPDWLIDPAFSTPFGWGPRTLVWFPDATPFNQYGSSGARRLLLQAVVLDSIRRAGVLAFATNSVLEEYRELRLISSSDCRVRLIPLGVGHDQIRGSATEADGSIVWIGSAGARKDFRTFERAMVLAGADWRAVTIVGSPGLATPTGVRRFIGGTAADLKRIIERSSVVIITSLYEGFSLPVVEASAVGTPLFLSDISVHREVAPEGAAIFFEAGSPESLGTLIKAEAWRQIPRVPRWKRSWDEVAAEVVSALGGTEP